MSFVESFEPQALWKHFDEILKIPRGSKEEEAMRQYVIGVAQGHGLEHRLDEAGNVVVLKPAAPGCEGKPVTILQSHLDMVNEKNSDVEHDFSKDPIVPRREGDYLTATGTTLGSDNGIGVASMLAIMESSDIRHGPLELLFTVDEETGLTGATELGADMLAGRFLINLDSEEEGVLTIGCAGGADSHLMLPLRHQPSPSGHSAAMQVKLSGLKGGHSGVDIHLQRGNAVKLLGRALSAAALKSDFLLASLEGGNKHNAIPREAACTLTTGQPDALKAALEEEFQAVQDEYRPADPGLKYEIVSCDPPTQVWEAETTRKALNLIGTLPHGVQSMSYDIADLVETSTNLAAVRRSNSTLSFLMSSRSSVDSALTALRRQIRSAADLAGAETEEGNGYPGWKPDVHSALLKVVKETHERILGSSPSVTAIHAGLECGIIGEKYPGMDMISIGPQIEFPHSPDERVKIPSVGDFYRLLAATLEGVS